MKNLFNNFDEFFNEFENLFSYKPVRITGNVKNETGSDEFGDWSKQTYSSKDGSFQVISFSRNGKSTKTSSNRIDQLKSELEKCVELQEFEKACDLRDQIKKLETNTKRLSELKSELEKAVKDQNFEKAIELRDEINSLS
jgi:excinuclease UvrABC helicase subunit UvrB